MKKVGVYLLIMLLLPCFMGTAQQLAPPIQNYSSIHYNAASQNWDIDVDEEGIVYAANNQGLLEFDGQRWELFPLKSGSIIRSVYPHEGRVYTGSYQEFGYWERDSTGKLRYNSLMHLLGDHVLKSEEFWEILSYNDAIYFRSFGAIYKYEGDTILPVKKVVSHKMVVYNNKLLLAVGDDGLYYLEENGELVPLPNQKVLEGKTILDMEVRQDTLLIGTREGLFEFDGLYCRPYKDRNLNEMLRKFELNHILVISNDEIVLGTVKKGIVHYNETSGKASLYNRDNGLQNNTVLGMARKNGKIWLALDNGIDAIDINSPIDFFLDSSGELGSVYDLAFFDNKFYLASNTGVYNIVNEELQLVTGSQGHSWNLEVLGNTLYNNHNTGTYKMVNDAVEPIDSRTGSFQILNADEKLHLIGNYTGISLYDEGLETLKNLNDITFPVKQIVFENPSTIWAAHAYEGIYRIGLAPALDSSTFINKIHSTENAGDYNPEIYKINNQIVVLANGKWYRYNSFTDNLEVLEEWEDYEDYKLLYEDQGLFWFIGSTDNAIQITNFKGSEVTITSKMLNNRVVKDHEKIIKSNDSIFYVTLHDGFARINLNKLLDFKNTEYISTPIVKQIFDNEKSYDLSALPHIPNKNAREVTILAGLPVSDANSLEYELIGKDTIRGEVMDGVIKFQNLLHDEYQLNLMTLSPQNTASVLTSFKFVVDPPWYLTTWMRFFYGLMLLSLVGLVLWINNLKLKKHQRVLEEKYEKEHEERISNLEKEQLINEITLKRKELANSTLMAAKKNEVLMEIQGELNKDKVKFSNQYRLKQLMNKINNAVKNKDEWKVFETNFNELHEGFFKDILAAYPKLSNKDLKLCSYLKMNLTSKEIAPLMGITVRGVEVHRYRLRKKMDLDSTENLTNFLITNF